MPDIDYNRVIEGPSGQSATALEQAADACALALLAAAYPSDTAVRQRAIQACASAGINYIETVATIAERGELAPDVARWALADHLGARIGELRKRGAVAREGILFTGYPANALGLPIDSDLED